VAVALALAGPPAPAALATRPLTSGDLPSRLQFNFGRAVAVDGNGGVHVAWLTGSLLEPTNPGATLGQVVYRMSPDGGATWGPPRPLTPAPVPFTGHPKVAAAGPHVYVVWHTPMDGTLKVVLSHSPDAGAHWEGPRVISDGAGAAWPSVAAWADTVHVVWGDQRTGTAEIYLRSSPDGGHHWTPTRPVSTEDGRSSWTGSVAAEGATIHVAWADERHNTDAQGHAYDCGLTGQGCREEEYYRRSTDFGQSWEDEVRLTADPPGSPRPSWAPSVAVDGGQVHVAFFDQRSGHWQVYDKRSRGAGAVGTWETERPLAAHPRVTFARPSVAVRGGRVHIVFWGEWPEGARVYHVGSPDGGDHFAPAADLTPLGRRALHPSVAVSSHGVAHVVWYDQDGHGIDQGFYAALTPR
jgi:hypothetical protein